MAVIMLPMVVATASLSPPQTGSGCTVKGAAEKVGLLENKISTEIYSL